MDRRMPNPILVVDDDAVMCKTLEAALARRGFQVTWRTNAQEAFELLPGGAFDAVLSDLNMKGMGGLELCERIVANRPDLPVLVMTAFGSLDSAIAAIRAGAYDFVTKPFEMDALELALRRAIEHRLLRDEVKRLRLEVERSKGPDELIGESLPMRKVHELISRLQDSDASVLVTGESGTGKEVLARALHRSGRRKDGPFVAVNCAAMPGALLESELFGHAKGAFTDAKTSRAGLFVQASGGTLLLDEIGELPLELQPKLLRALQERSVRPVGADEEVPFDVRLISATNRDLEAAVDERRFREDLFFRINVVHLGVPPLRSRGNDILVLAQRFLGEFAARSKKSVLGLSPAVAERLRSYAWPGNVRELQNCIERAVAMAVYAELTVEDLPERIRDYKSSHVVVASDDPAELLSMEEVERRYILRVLEAVGGQKSTAARVLGLDRKTLYRKLERYGVMGKDDSTS
jgi:two-component system, NtrC family, response regulator AtoC